MSNDTILGLKMVRRAIVKLTDFIYPGGHSIAPIPEMYLGAMVSALNTIANQALEQYPPHHMSNEQSADTLLWNSLQRIARLTSDELRGQSFYCGDRETITEVWDEADRTPKYSKHGRYVYKGDLRSVTVSETWGPFQCEHTENGKCCGEGTFAIYLSRAELQDIPYEAGPNLIKYIVDGKNSKGQALCEDHAPALCDAATTPTV